MDVRILAVIVRSAQSSQDGFNGTIILRKNTTCATMMW